MSDWQPNQYLKFEKERTQPAIDLLNRIESSHPRRVIDIGCGPGNSTKILRDRWETAEIIGLDNSKAMLEKAGNKYSDIEWVLKDSNEDLSFLGKFDVVFSNAAFQWLPDHSGLIKKLFEMLNTNGVLAVQVPCVKHLPVYAEIQKIIRTKKWTLYFQSPPEYPKHFTFSHYYDILCELTTELYAWQTDYIHIMKSHDDIVEWYKGTGLRPFLDMLPTEELKAEFCEEYKTQIASAYSVEKDKNVLLPFTRIFFTAYKI